MRSVVVLHDEKGEEIGPVIKNGRPQAGMPAFPTLSQEDFYNIAEYIHLQVELAANRGTYGATYAGLRSQSSGDAKKGEEFFKRQLPECHSVTGDLAKIGAKLPAGGQPCSRDSCGQPRPVRPKLQSLWLRGRPIAGTVETLNDFEVSMYDSGGRLSLLAARSGEGAG